MSNISAGVPRRLRPALNNVFLALMAGLGLASAFLDVLDRETRRTVRIIRLLREGAIYADRDLEL